MRVFVVKPLLPSILLAMLGGMLGVAALLLPAGARFEAAYGLSWLYSLRGVRQPPPDVLVISLDRESAQQMAQPSSLSNWDRRLHAALVDRLAAYGASVIVFDLFFARPRLSDPEQDDRFAASMKRAGNVLLYAELRAMETTAGRVEAVIPPHDLLADAALDWAPHVLPKSSARVEWCWLFKEGAGDLPVLSVVALQQHAVRHFEHLRNRVEQEDGIIPLVPPSTAIREMREWFRLRPGVAKAWMEAADDPLLQALLALFVSPARHRLDFYGPAHTLPTISYHELFTRKEETLRKLVAGKAIFIGAAERAPAHPDDFYTVYREAGIDLSGVEIAATLFANLLERRSVRELPAPLRWGWVLLWGGMLGLLWFWMHPALVATTIPLFATLLTAAAAHAFSREGLWLPVAIPLLVQMPLILISVLGWRYLYAWKEREKVRVALRRLLPEDVVFSITRGVDCEVESRTVFGVCMATDADSYTALSERMEPEALRRYLNHYYRALFGPVERQGGFVSDVVGDAMMAVWTATTPVWSGDSDIRLRACRAAVEILCNTIRATGAENGVMPTRIGLHCGPISLGHIGAGEHYEYRAVGDTVNTASRIEGLNKLLGTSILASAEVVKNVTWPPSREVGCFLLKGKLCPITIHELQCSEDKDSPIQRLRNRLFGEALHLFREQRWQEAERLFRQIIEQFGEDGPSRFYLDICMRRDGERVAVGEKGVVILKQK